MLAAASQPPALTLTMWPSMYSRWGRRQHLTWPRFLEAYVAGPEITPRKHSTAGYSLASFADNRRGLAHVEHVHALGLDYDEGSLTLEAAARLWRKALGCIYTTWSHEPHAPRVRCVLLLSRPVTAEEYGIIWTWADSRSTRAGHALDASAKDASRFWFVPSIRPGAEYAWRELRGAVLDVESLVRATTHLRPLPAKSPKPPKRRGPGKQEGGVSGVCLSPEIAPANRTFFGRALELCGLSLYQRKDGSLTVVCPWEEQHTGGAGSTPDRSTSTVIFPATSESLWGLFHCSHAHCAQRKTLDLLDVLPPDALEAARLEHGRGLVRARIVRGHMQHFEPVGPAGGALDRLDLWCVPVGYVARGGFRMTVKIASEMHSALDSLPLERLLGRRVDVVRVDVVRIGAVVTRAKLVPDDLSGPKAQLRARASSILTALDPGAAVVGADCDFVSALLRRHPRAVDMIGPGLRKIRVGAAMAGKRLFEVERVDGSRVAFSYLSSLRETASAPRRGGA
jgi:hypothetical protein